MEARRLLANAAQNAEMLWDAGRSHNLKVMASLVAPAIRGMVFPLDKAESEVVAGLSLARLDWSYDRDHPDLALLYEHAKSSQWDAATSLDWSVTVDPFDPSRELIAADAVPFQDFPSYRGLGQREQARQRELLAAWLVSQFLHGEQGALLAAAQVTESVQWLDARLLGASQVADEARHVEVFQRYLREKLEKSYRINHGLHVILEALLADARWDVKFLGMQVLVEGLALGAFATMRAASREPLLRELLRNVIADEGRHVQFGVAVLREYYGEVLPEKQRQEREDWAYEIAVFVRNQLLAHEFYEEHYAHLMSRAEWDRRVLASEFAQRFHRAMFRRVVPNLARIHLLSDRVRPHWAKLGLLVWENEPAAPELSASQLLET